MWKSQHRRGLDGWKWLDWCDERVNSCFCLLTYRSYVLENQNSLSGQAIASDMVRIGDYELLEKKKEGFETN